MPAVKPSRESLIALRARHQAYRIASDIAYPHVEVPPPPQPVIPIEDAVYYRPLTWRERLRRVSGMFWVLVILLVGAAFLIHEALVNYCLKWGPRFGL